MSTTPLVSIRCLVYNHEPYLRQCLEGFVMQKTNFPFEAIVHDDASTDGSAAIIREYAEKYPDIIKPIYETENQYSKRDGSLRRIMNEHTRGKYVAICEGDDYWIDPLKLQKQVDFLEANPEYVMSHTSIKYYFHNQKRFVASRDIQINKAYKGTDQAIDILFSNYRIQTVSVIYRRNVAESVCRFDTFLFSGRFLQGDTQLWYSLCRCGKIHFLPEVTAVYRKNDGSVTATKNVKKRVRFMLSFGELRMYLAQRDHFPSEIQERIKRIYAPVLLAYEAFNPNFKPLYEVDTKTYADKYYYLNRMHLLKPYLIGFSFLKEHLRPLRNRLVRSI